MPRFPLFALPLLAVALPAHADVPKVVTDIPAVHALTAQVMGDLGRPEILLEQGGNAHNYQLKPSQARSLQEADLVIWIGPKMTPWLGRAIEGVALGGKEVGLLEAQGTHRQDFGAGAQAHDHDDHGHTEAAPEAHGPDHEAAPLGHSHTGVDPHAWLDPANAGHWLGLIAAELAAADPANAETYARNATAAQAEVAALDARLATQLAPVADRPFVVFHDAYGYFAAHYGLTVAGSVALGDATDPGAGHLRELRAELAEKGVICAFPEAQHDPKQLDILLEGTTVKRGDVLDPSGSQLPYGPGLYARLITDLAEDLVACLAP